MSRYGAIRTMPQTCQAESGAAGPAGRAPPVSSSASVAISMRSLRSSCPGLSRPSTSFIFSRGCQAKTGYDHPGISRSLHYLLDAGDHLVDRGLDRHLLVHYTVHGLGPDVLVVENSELVVLGELESHGAGVELLVDRLAVRVLLPERTFLRGLGHGEPAAERALHVRRQILLLQQEADEFLGPRLVPGVGEDRAGFDCGAIHHRRAIGLLRKARGVDQLGIILLSCRAVLGRV